MNDFCTPLSSFVNKYEAVTTETKNRKQKVTMIFLMLTKKITIVKR